MDSRFNMDFKACRCANRDTEQARQFNEELRAQLSLTCTALRRLKAALTGKKARDAASSGPRLSPGTKQEAGK